MIPLLSLYLAGFSVALAAPSYFLASQFSVVAVEAAKAVEIGDVETLSCCSLVGLRKAKNPFGKLMLGSFGGIVGF